MYDSKYNFSQPAIVKARPKLSDLIKKSEILKRPPGWRHCVRYTVHVMLSTQLVKSTNLERYVRYKLVRYQRISIRERISKFFVSECSLNFVHIHLAGTSSRSDICKGFWLKLYNGHLWKNIFWSIHNQWITPPNYILF